MKALKAGPQGASSPRSSSASTPWASGRPWSPCPEPAARAPSPRRWPSPLSSSDPRPRSSSWHPTSVRRTIVLRMAKRSGSWPATTSRRSTTTPSSSSPASRSDHGRTDRVGRCRLSRPEHGHSRRRPGREAPPDRHGDGGALRSPDEARHLQRLDAAQARDPALLPGAGSMNLSIWWVHPTTVERHVESGPEGDVYDTPAAVTGLVELGPKPIHDAGLLPVPPYGDHPCLGDPTWRERHRPPPLRGESHNDGRIARVPLPPQETRPALKQG